MSKRLTLPIASFLALAWLLPVASAQEGGGKRAFEITDYYRTAFPSGPAVSPDGAWIAVAVRRYDVEADTTWSEIWRVRPDGSGLRQMTSGEHNDGTPSFTPDGRLAFVSDRSGSSQIWTMPIDGGEPEALTDFGPGLSDPVWSDDGRWIAASAELYTDCGVDLDCHEKREKAAEKGKLSVHVADDLLYRHWTSWADGMTTHVLLFDATSGELVRDLTPGPWVSPVFSLGGDRGYAFSPDGDELLFVSNRDADPAESTNADLWAVPTGEGAEGATPAQLTAGAEGWDGAPLFSPDGKSLAYITQRTPGYESDLRELAVMDRASGEKRVLVGRSAPEGWSEDWVDDMRWSPDGKALLFQAEVKGRNPIFRIGADGRGLDRIVADGLITGWEPTPDGETIAYIRRTVGSPPELFVVPASGGAPRQLTHFNAELEAEVDIRPAEEMWVKGAGDYDVHVFVVKPHGFREGERYPLILNVHGGPQSQWTDAYRGDWQVYPGKGYVVAFANPTGSTGYGQDFVEAISKDWGGRVFEDLMKVADALEQLPYVDPDRMGAMGWSYGGYMMMWFQGHTDRFKCQAAMMGLYDLRSFYGSTEELWFPEFDVGGTPWTSELYERWSPSNFVDEFSTPALVITGERDYRVPYTQSLQYFTALQKKDVPSRLVVLPGSGHWPGWREMMFYYNAHLDWFHRWLGGDPAPWDVIEHARQHGIPEETEAQGE